MYTFAIERKSSFTNNRLISLYTTIDLHNRNKCINKRYASSHADIMNILIYLRLNMLSHCRHSR